MLPIKTMIVPYAGDAGSFTRLPIGWVLHVQAGNGSPYRWFSSLSSPDRVFSHFWVSKTGIVERYQDLLKECWAQGDGNASYWGVETEGFPSEPLTRQQINSLAQLHMSLGTPDRLAHTPGDAGIATHGMGGNAWGGHPGCPGTPRTAQRVSILAEVATLKGVTPVRPPYLGSVLTIGSRGSQVRLVQNRLTHLGWPLVTDGVYGTLTASAVYHFQVRHGGLVSDGIVGPNTWVALWA